MSNAPTTEPKFAQVRPALAAGLTIAFDDGRVGVVERRAPRIGRPGTWWDVRLLDRTLTVARDGDVRVLVDGGWR
ncbi:hypothetical protein [Agromyces humi]|uniref:hypothetical protein n=1 Tax=Agromyces humi TaxID=1766800 RepID=UPI00135C2815|nr:hypothetical protein [Agromyces humi]